MSQIMINFVTNKAMKNTIVCKWLANFAKVVYITLIIRLLANIQTLLESV